MIEVSQADGDCKTLLDQMPFEGIPYCEDFVNNELSSISNHQRHKDEELQFICQIAHSQVNNKIGMSLVSLNPDIYNFKREMIGAKYSIIELQISLLVQANYIENLLIEVTYGNTTEHISFQIKERPFLESWKELRFSGTIQSNGTDLLIRVIDSLNQISEKIINTQIIFTEFFVWGTNTFNPYLPVCNLEKSKEPNRSLLKQIPQIISCSNGLIFHEKLLKCIRFGFPCGKTKKESLKTNDCLEICLEDEMEFALPSNGMKYCTEKYYHCYEPCEICDKSGSICLKCKKGYKLLKDKVCKIEEVNESIFHNFFTEIFLKSLKSSEKNPHKQNQNLQYLNSVRSDTQTLRLLSSSTSSTDTDDGHQVCLQHFEYFDCYLCRVPYIMIHGDCYMCPRGTQPIDDYYSSYCKKIPIEGCSDVDSSSNCLACFLGYQLTGGLCVKLTTSCTSSQYQTVSGSCVNCPSHCTSCYTSTICKTCENNYHLSYQITNPSQFSSNSGSLPTLLCQPSCSSGFFLNVDNLCEPCGFRCLTCTNPGTTCTACMPSYENPAGFYNVPTTKGRCMWQGGDCPSGANTCQIVDGTKRNTNTCKPKFIFQNDVCYYCGYNCNNCATPTTCYDCINSNVSVIGGQCNFTCPPGTFSDYNNNCQSCITNCQTCTNLYTCDRCGLKFISLGGQCVSCPSNCDSCSNEVTCSTCSFGYTLDTTTKLCVSSGSIITCPTQCSACSASNVCTSCVSTYYYLESNSCIACVNPCSRCSSASVCLSCVTGYSFNSPGCEILCGVTQFRESSTNTCQNCISNCDTCSDSSSCIVCSTGFQYLNNHTCFYGSMCGDGNTSVSMVASGELVQKQCDDMNTTNGDGCSSTCTVESGYTCEYSSSLLKSVCSKIQMSNDFTLNPQSNQKNNDPIIKVKFTSPLVQYSTLQLLEALKSDMSVSISTVSASEYSYSLNLNSENTELTLKFVLQIAAKNRIFTLNFNSPQFVIKNKLAHSSKSSDFPDYVIVTSTDQKASQITAALGLAAYNSILITIIPTILFSNFQILFTAFDLFQMIFYLQFVDVRIPFNAVEFINIMSPSISVTPTNFIQTYLDFFPLRNSYVPTPFSDNNIDGVFLGNTGDSISQVLIILSVHLLLKQLSRFLVPKESASLKKIGVFLKQKLYQSWEYGWYLDMYWEMYLSLVVGAVLQLYQIEVYSVVSAINIIATFLVLGFVVTTPVIFLKIIHQKKHKLEEEEVRFKWGMLYESLKIVDNQTVHPLPPSTSQLNQLDIQMEKNNEIKSLKSEKLSVFNQQQNMIDLKQSSPKKITNLKLNRNTVSIIDLNSEQFIGTKTPQTKLSFVFDGKLNSTSNIFDKVFKKEKTRSFFSFEDIKLHFHSARKNISKYFYAILYSRKLLFGVLIASLTPSPYTQLILISILNFILLSMILLSKPFHLKLENFKTVICEILMMISQISFIFLVEDPQEQSESQRLSIGWVFISCCLAILLIQCIFIFCRAIPDTKKQIMLFFNLIKEKIKKNQIPQENQPKSDTNKEKKLGEDLNLNTPNEIKKNEKNTLPEQLENVNKDPITFNNTEGKQNRRPKNRRPKKYKTEKVNRNDIILSQDKKENLNKNDDFIIEVNLKDHQQNLDSQQHSFNSLQNKNLIHEGSENKILYTQYSKFFEGAQGRNEGSTQNIIGIQQNEVPQSLNNIEQLLDQKQNEETKIQFTQTSNI